MVIQHDSTFRKGNFARHKSGFNLTNKKYAQCVYIYIYIHTYTASKRHTHILSISSSSSASASAAAATAAAAAPLNESCLVFPVHPRCSVPTFLSVVPYIFQKTHPETLEVDGGFVHLLSHNDLLYSSGYWFQPTVLVASAQFLCW